MWSSNVDCGLCNIFVWENRFVVIWPSFMEARLLFPVIALDYCCEDLFFGVPMKMQRYRLRFRWGLWRASYYYADGMVSLRATFLVVVRHGDCRIRGYNRPFVLKTLGNSIN